MRKIMFEHNSELWKGGLLITQEVTIFNRELLQPVT